MNVMNDDDLKIRYAYNLIKKYKNKNKPKAFYLFGFQNFQ